MQDKPVYVRLFRFTSQDLTIHTAVVSHATADERFVAAHYHIGVERIHRLGDV